MGRLIEADKLFPDVMKVDGSVAISQGQLAHAPTVEAIPKDQLTELRSMALRVKHNTGSIDTLIDKLDDLLKEVQE